MSSLRSQRGSVGAFGLIGFIVLLGVLYYSMKSMRGGEGEKGPVQAISKATDGACAAQRAQLARDIVLFEVGHPDQKPTIELMERSGIRIPPCPGGGTYEVHGRKVLCTEHSYQDEFEAADSD